MSTQSTKLFVTIPKWDQYFARVWDRDRNMLTPHERPMDQAFDDCPKGGQVMVYARISRRKNFCAAIFWF